MDDSDVSFKYHMGVKCIDYQIFFDKVRGQPLKKYLTSVEDDTHGIIHFTFGGVGGNRVYSTVHQLINTYGFSYSNVAAMAVSAQPFFKLYLAQNPTIYAMSGRTFPLNCTGNITLLLTPTYPYSFHQIHRVSYHLSDIFTPSHSIHCQRLAMGQSRKSIEINHCPWGDWWPAM